MCILLLLLYYYIIPHLLLCCTSCIFHRECGIARFLCEIRNSAIILIPLGYPCAKFRFCRTLHCWEKSRTQSLTQLIWFPRNWSFRFRTFYQRWFELQLIRFQHNMQNLIILISVHFKTPSVPRLCSHFPKWRATQICVVVWLRMVPYSIMSIHVLGTCTVMCTVGSVYFPEWTRRDGTELSEWLEHVGQLQI